MSPPYGVTSYGAVPTGCHVARPKVATSVHFIRDIRSPLVRVAIPELLVLSTRVLAYAAPVAVGNRPYTPIRPTLDLFRFEYLLHVSIITIFR